MAAWIPRSMSGFHALPPIAGGVLLRRDHPLAAKESISPEDLWEEPLIFSRQVLKKNSHADVVRRWLKKPILLIHKLV